MAEEMLLDLHQVDDMKQLLIFFQERCDSADLLHTYLKKTKLASRCCFLSSNGCCRSVLKFVAGAILPRVVVCEGCEDVRKCSVPDMQRRC